MTPSAHQIGSRVRPDGRVAIRFKDGTVRMFWPIDAREMMSKQPDLELADDPKKVVRQPEEDKGPQAPLSPRKLAPPPPRMPGAAAKAAPPSSSKVMPPAPAGGDDYGDE